MKVESTHIPTKPHFGAHRESSTLRVPRNFAKQVRLDMSISLQCVNHQNVAVERCLAEVKKTKLGYCIFVRTPF